MKVVTRGPSAPSASPIASRVQIFVGAMANPSLPALGGKTARPSTLRHTGGPRTSRLRSGAAKNVGDLLSGLAESSSVFGQPAHPVEALTQQHPTPHRAGHKPLSVAPPQIPPPGADPASVRPTRSELNSAILSEDMFDSDVWAWRRAKLREIIFFVIPALAIPLSDPLMSMLDTVCVGRFASTTQLASLGPPALVFYFITNLFLCQGMAVTALVSRALEKGNLEKAQRALTAGLVLSVTAGILITVGLEVFGPQVLKATGAAADLIPPALTYLKIRALGLTAVFISNVGQGALLAQKDTVAPAVAIGTACVVNTILDLFLIGGLGWGVAGAAAATLVAQIAECGATIWAVFNRGKVVPIKQRMSKAEVKAFKDISGPLSFVYLCRNLCMGLIQLKATALCVLSVAAHQPIWSLWSFCSKTTAPLEQAALVFLPSCRGAEQRKNMIALILMCGLGMGLISGVVACLVPYFAPFWFTPDTALYPVMRAVALQAIISQFLLGINVAHNGILIAQDDTSFLGGQLFRTLLALLGFCQLSTYMGWGLGGVWWALVVFFIAQCSQSTYRVSTRHLGLFQTA